MRKLIKNKQYATSFHNWEKANGEKRHPDYDSKDIHYKDVLVELLINQDGLCAYTEYRLVSSDRIEDLKNAFDDEGKFTGTLKDYPIDLEHFDSKVKVKFAWRYSNLFVVHSTINQKTKRREENKLLRSGKSVYSLMKPDGEEYDENRLLCYDKTFNIFLPNEEQLNPVDINQVTEMIICLGLNNGYIKDKRKEYYNELKFKQVLGIDIIPEQFMTGWNMINRV